MHLRVLETLGLTKVSNTPGAADFVTLAAVQQR